jgi:hypothetical protein
VKTVTATTVRRWRAAFAAAAVAVGLLLAGVAPNLTDSAGLVKLRNALLMQDAPATYDWTPAALPPGFAVDDASVPAALADIVRRHGLARPGADWEAALAIARHLLSGGRRASGPIQSDLMTTYRRIVDDGAGYCGDYADVFTALAHAAGIFSRSWAFSFDGFGGHGHIFNEVWDAQSGSWRMIDIHNNVRPVGPDGQPLSAMQVRRRLLADEPFSMVPIEPATRPGYGDARKLFDYYRRGLPQWYLWWGSNVIEYDQAAPVRALSPAGRSAEQLGGIAAGVARGFRVVQTSENEPARRALQRLRVQLLVLPLALLVLAVTAWCWWRSRAVLARGQAHARRVSEQRA